jgi:hypothetical protein
LSAHHKTVLRRKFVDTPVQQSVKQANGAFGQVIAKTAQEFRLSLGLIRRQSQRLKSADLTAFFCNMRFLLIHSAMMGRMFFFALIQSLPAH